VNLLALEDAVLAATREVIGDAPLQTAPLTRAIIDRSRRYTSERDRLSQPADRTADLAARAAFFTIADAPKVAVPIAELAARGAIPPRRPLRITDIGAGCGALSLGLVASLANDELGGAMFEFTLIDRDVDALRIAAGALRHLAAAQHTELAITTRVADVTETSLPSADLVLAGTVLNELPEAARLPLARGALASLADDGALIIVEPALRDTSRALHTLRDQLLALGPQAAPHVFAPCTRQLAPCPMLANAADWCHESRRITWPPHTHELARITHLRDDGLKFSYLTLRKQRLRLADAPNAWRVVSEPRAPKGKVELDGCSDAGLVPLRLLRRHRSDANRTFERAERGDVVVTDATEITADTAVERRTFGR
jgi:ribosomal protein RSM22 (predicted rRNA methylase)